MRSPAKDTVTQLIAQIRRVGREVPAAKDLIGVHCTRLVALTGQDYRTTGKPPIAWDDPAARDELVSALVDDALALLAALDVDAITKAGGKPAEAVALLALVAGQDVEPAQDSDGSDGCSRIARKTAPDRVISPFDPDARHAQKTRERRQDGFKAHVVVEPATGLMTMCELTKTNGSENSDANVGANLVTNGPTVAEGQDLEVLGDLVYASGDMLYQLKQKTWTPLVKPWPLRLAVAGGFTLDDFVYDAVAATLTCPAGLTRSPSAKGNVTFGVACRGCPLASSATSASGRTVSLGEHHQLQREHRQCAADQGFQPVYRQRRPMVERSIAWLTRGARRVPYRVIEKNNHWLHHRVAGLTLRRLFAMALTNQNGTRVLA